MKKKILTIITLLVLFAPVMVYAEATSCPLGPQVTKDLKGALGIFQILGPILMMCYTVWELIKTVSMGEVEKEAKKFFTRLAKRIVACIMLFFTPLLLNQIFQLFGLYGDGACDLDNPTEVNCSTLSGSSDCEANGCSWNSILKECSDSNDDSDDSSSDDEIEHGGGGARG